MYLMSQLKSRVLVLNVLYYSQQAVATADSLQASINSCKQSLHAQKFPTKANHIYNSQNLTPKYLINFLPWKIHLQ